MEPMANRSLVDGQFDADHPMVGPTTASGSSIAAMVVEGGGMRGIFSAGILDVFHEHGFNPFDLAIGCSAGACNLASFLAGQHERNRRCYLTQMLHPEAVSISRFLRGGHLMDLDFLWQAFAQEDPLDIPRVMANPTRLVIATTSVDSGEPVFIEPEESNLWGALRASCALPLLYRGFVELEGQLYADGGVSAPIPVVEAYRRGARKILVLRSRPSGYVKQQRLEGRLGGWLLRHHPGISRALQQSHQVYELSRRFIAAPPADCRIVEIAPPRPLRGARITRDASALLEDYGMGRSVGLEAMSLWAQTE
jgi:predicted patatin/cPLA2 family phospholipase